MPKKKILATAFEFGRPVQATAAWDGENLFILEIMESAGDSYSWIMQAKKGIEEKAEAGWVTLVADRTLSFPASSAILWNVNAINASGKTSLQASLEMYFALQSRNALFFEPHLKKYQIHLGGENDMAYLENDDRGRSVFRINWQNFKSSHLAALMCVAGACMEEPLSDRWLKVFCGAKRPEKELPVWPVFRAMNNLVRKQHDEFEAKVEQMEAQKHA